MAVKAGRQGWMIVLYLFVAIPTTILLLFFLNPTFSAKATDYVKDFAGLHHGPDSSSEPAPVAELEEALVSPSAVNAPPSTVPLSLSAALATPDRAEALSAMSQYSSISAASVAATPTPTDAEEGSSEVAAAASATPSAWNEEKWWFQGDLGEEEYALPKFDIPKLRHMAPHNYEGPGHETFATFYATRNATVHDPYFLAAMQIVYRVLWGQDSKSKHPMTVFVPPFISQEQRDYFTAAGAIVRELALLPFTPDGETQGRWKDQFSKLEMWKQTDFSRIVYLDSDVFPMNNTDGIFDVVPEQTCNRKKLSVQDKTYASSICNYVFAAAHQFEQSWTINAGVMVLKPEHAMYDHLVRGMKERKGWDTKMMEQSMLNYMFRKDGPFPRNLLDPKWNAGSTWTEDGKGWGFHYVHDKMWGHFFPPGVWVLQEYKDTWAKMLELFNSEEFVKMRKEDHQKTMAGIKNVDKMGNDKVEDKEDISESNDKTDETEASDAEKQEEQPTTEEDNAEVKDDQNEATGTAEVQNDTTETNEEQVEKNDEQAESKDDQTSTGDALSETQEDAAENGDQAETEDTKVV